MNNYGFEVTLGTRKEFQNGLRLNISGNVSLAKNKMVEMFETASTYDNPNRRRTGRALNTVFGYKTLGFFSTAEDTNSDGIIDSYMMVTILPSGEHCIRVTSNMLISAARTVNLTAKLTAMTKL